MVFLIVWITLGIGFLLLFAATVLPRIMLRMRAAASPVRDRAADRPQSGETKALAYIPSDAVRPYIKRYEIVRDENGLFFRGEWTCARAFAAYELTVYGSDNRILEVLRVKETFNGGQFTHETRLPKKTDYVTLRMLCVDDTPIPAEPQPFRKQFAAWLALLCGCLAAVTDLLLWLCVTLVLNCLDHFTMTLRLPASVWAALLCYTALAVVVLTCAFSIGGFFLRRLRYHHETRA